MSGQCVIRWRLVCGLLGVWKEKTGDDQEWTQQWDRLRRATDKCSFALFHTKTRNMHKNSSIVSDRKTSGGKLIRATTLIDPNEWRCLRTALSSSARLFMGCSSRFYVLISFVRENRLTMEQVWRKRVTNKSTKITKLLVGMCCEEWNSTLKWLRYFVRRFCTRGRSCIMAQCKN